MTRSTKYVPEGFHSLTPYLVCGGVARLLEFLKEAFEAEETVRATRADGSITHACVRIADSMLEMGEASGDWTPMLAGLHLYVKNAAEVHQRAVKAGGESLYEPRDMDYGDLEGGIKDPSGNHWYIATHKSGRHFTPEGLRSITAGASVKGAAEFLLFLERAFGASVAFKNASPQGVVAHAKVQIGDSMLECSEAHGEWGPRPMAFHFYVPNADAVYKTAISAGGKSLSEPKDQPYGERSGGVMDAWGNHWYITTHTENLTIEELRSRTAAQGESVK
jgi:PhnB protein